MHQRFILDHSLAFGKDNARNYSGVMLADINPRMPVVGDRFEEVDFIPLCSSPLTEEVLGWVDINASLNLSMGSDLYYPALVEPEEVEVGEEMEEVQEEVEVVEEEKEPEEVVEEEVVVEEVEEEEEVVENVEEKPEENEVILEWAPCGNSTPRASHGFDPNEEEESRKPLLELNATNTPIACHGGSFIHAKTSLEMEEEAREPLKEVNACTLNAAQIVSDWTEATAYSSLYDRVKHGRKRQLETQDQEQQEPDKKKRNKKKTKRKSTGIVKTATSRAIMAGLIPVKKM